MKPRLLFDLPVLRRATADSFDTRPTALDRWFAQLPMGSIGESCREIFMALYEVNRTQVTPSQRLAFLERLAEPLALVLPALQHHYFGQPFPLPEKAQQVARLAVDLQVELVIGYRLVLEGVRHQPWYKPWGRKPRKALAAHRMLHYLGNILIDYQWQHLPYPRGVWRTVHRIFRHEGKAGRMRWPVPPLAGTDSTTTVLEEYKRVLLCALVPPSRISIEQWHALGRHLQQWLPLIRLDPTSVEYGFWVRIDSDSPPTELPMDFTAAMGRRGKYTVLNTRPLIEQLEHLLMDPSVAFPAGLTRDSIETLRNAWSGARGRHAERRRGRGQEMQLLVGVGALYQALGGKLPTLPETLDLTRTDGNDNGRAWVHNTMPTAPPQPVIARVVDQSESGYGLELTTAPLQPLREGEIVGLRSQTVPHWEICYVCWLRAVEGKPVSLGVQHLALEALPVEVMVGVESGHSAPLGSLLGTTATGETALFMPNLPGVEHKVLQLGYRGHVAAIVLQERLDASSGFAAFLFDTPAHAHQAGLAAQEAWRHRAAAPEAAAAEADRYSEVWNTL
ncbi:hypothetical protein [Sulfurivermis fontis]|uniref:hypothetical protein n=1 Tax=Sulfurivermis fontis TaxID=1972068 RepID=UPI000FD82BC0|nr:hypothetical protein [Sulfurivermis fontis]